MRKLFIVFLIAFGNYCYSQDEHLNKNALHSSPVYASAVAMLDFYDIPQLEQVYFYPNKEGVEPIKLQATILNNTEGAVQKINIYLTTKKNEGYGICLKVGYDFSEMAVMIKRDGISYEVDYGFPEKKQVPSLNNDYLNQYDLEYGSQFIFKDLYTLVSFVVPGFNGVFYITPK